MNTLQKGLPTLHKTAGQGWGAPHTTHAIEVDHAGHAPSTVSHLAQRAVDHNVRSAAAEHGLIGAARTANAAARMESPSGASHASAAAFGTASSYTARIKSPVTETMSLAGPDLKSIKGLVVGRPSTKEQETVDALREQFTHIVLAKDGTIDIEKTQNYASLLKQRSIAPGELFHAQKVVTVDKYLTPDAPKVKTAGFIPLTGEVADTSSFYEVWSALTDSQRYLLAVAAIKNPGQYANQSNEDSVELVLTAVAAGKPPRTLQKIQAMIDNKELSEEDELSAQALLKTGKLLGSGQVPGDLGNRSINAALKVQAERDLYELLLAFFSNNEEVRSILRWNFPKLSEHMPFPNISRAEYTAKVAQLLMSTGNVSWNLMHLLCVERPRRTYEVNAFSNKYAQIIS